MVEPCALTSCGQNCGCQHNPANTAEGAATRLGSFNGGISERFRRFRGKDPEEEDPEESDPKEKDHPAHIVVGDQEALRPRRGSVVRMTDEHDYHHPEYIRCVCQENSEGKEQSYASRETLLLS